MTKPATRLLSNPAKMPGRAFGLPALKSCPGAVLAPDETGRKAICAGCYALDGNYRYAPVRRSQEIRYEWVKGLMRSRQGRRGFVTTMVKAIGRLKEPYFRIHDSGDFFSEVYVRAWVEIAKQLPGVKFWAPTRSYRNKTMIGALKELAALPNVVVRPSALHFGAPPPEIEGLQAGSGAGCEADHICPAPEQGGECGECRQCWDKDSGSVNYRVHGAKAKRLERESKQRLLPVVALVGAIGTGRSTTKTDTEGSSHGGGSNPATQGVDQG